MPLSSWELPGLESFLDERNKLFDEYGTNNLETIDLIKKYAQKKIDQQQENDAADKIAEMLPDIQSRERENALKNVRSEYRIAEGVKIFDLSTFINETVTIKGVELCSNHFIPERVFNTPVNNDIYLYFDDTCDTWFVRIKNGLPKLISRFVVTACLIVDASGPGSCRAYVVFLKGEAKPLIFWGGIIKAAELRKQTQFHQKGLSYARKDLYHESFVRALRMCKAVYFLTLPKHAGWNRTPQGLRVFVDSAMMQPEFEDLFLKEDSCRCAYTEHISPHHK